MDRSLITKARTSVYLPAKCQGLEVRGRRGSCTAPCKPDSPTGRASPLRGRVKQIRPGRQGEDFLNLSHPDNPRGCTKAAGVPTGRVLPKLHSLRVCMGGVGVSGGSDSTGNSLTQGDHSPPLLGAAGKASLAYPLPHSPLGPTHRAGHKEGRLHLGTRPRRAFQLPGKLSGATPRAEQILLEGVWTDVGATVTSRVTAGLAVAKCLGSSAPPPGIMLLQTEPGKPTGQPRLETGWRTKTQPCFLLPP